MLVFDHYGTNLTTSPLISEAILKSIELNSQVGQGRNLSIVLRPNSGVPQQQFDLPVALKSVFRAPSAFKPSFGSTVQCTYMPSTSGNNCGCKY